MLLNRYRSTCRLVPLLLKTAIFLGGSILVSLVSAQTAGSIRIQVDHPGPEVSSNFYGLMTEEINHSYDGGLYGELIQNRSFRDSSDVPTHWSAVGNAAIALDRTQIRDGISIPSLRVQISASSQTEGGAANDGYWGVPILPHCTYRATIVAQSSPGDSIPLQIKLENADGSKIVAQAQTPLLSNGWHTYSLTLRTDELAQSAEGRLVISTARPATFWIAYASLFPPTYNRRLNGNRMDLMKMLQGMHPTFLRFPGGNYLEGNAISERFNWKETLGDPTKRLGHQGPWGYRSSDGLGLLEFLEWCEDLKMPPVLAVFAGYALRGEHIDAGPKLQPFVQEALDEIEFVTGSTRTTWGAIRARLGHPKPFSLTYVEIGNEDFFDRKGYEGRFDQFFDAIRSKYSSLKLIATMPVKDRRPDLVDEHFYRSARGMAGDWRHYDSYDRSGPKIFVGEWASMEGQPTPNLMAGLGDAAWLMNLERNSDIVQMEAYAPLLVNVNKGAYQWRTNLIGYDALNSFGSPSYYVQALFGQNPGKWVLPVDVNSNLPSPSAKPYSGKLGVGSYDTEVQYKDIVVTEDGKDFLPSTSKLPGEGWSLNDNNWLVSDGSLQTVGAIRSQALAGNSAWTDYDIRLKARKISGREGFVVLFHFQDRGHFWQWNIGGWGNSATRLERVGGGWEDIGHPSSFKIVSNKWYDLKLSVHEGHVAGYIDGQLVTEANEQEPIPAIYATATQAASGDIVLKVVNLGALSAPLNLSFEGGPSLDSRAEAWTIAGDPEDQNSLTSPMQVAPKRKELENVSADFTYRFEPFSVTLLRIHPRP